MRDGQINPSSQRDRAKKAAHSASSGNISTNSDMYLDSLFAALPALIALFHHIYRCIITQEEVTGYPEFAILRRNIEINRAIKRLLPVGDPVKEPVFLVGE